MITPPPKTLRVPPTPNCGSSVTLETTSRSCLQTDQQEQNAPCGPLSAKVKSNGEIAFSANASEGFRDYLTSLLEELKGSLLTERSQIELDVRRDIARLRQEFARVRSIDTAEGTYDSNVIPLLESWPKRETAVQTRVDWAMESPLPAPPVPDLRSLELLAASGDLSHTPEHTSPQQHHKDGHNGLFHGIGWNSNREIKTNKDRLLKLLTVHDMYDITPKKHTAKESLVFNIDQMMGIVTFANLVVIGISCDIGSGWKGWLLIDVVFAIIFVCEMFAKVWILGCRHYWRGSDWGWNVLEAALVALAVLELAMLLLLSGEAKSKLSAVRVIRVARITRLIRVRKLSFFAELSQMVQGAIGGMRTLMWSVFLISVPLYGFSLVVHETLGQYDDDGTRLFSTLSSTLFTIWRCTVAGDCNQEDGKPIFVLVCNSYGWGFGMLYVLTQTFMTFGLFNVIVAIYVENIVAAAKHNDLLLKRHRLEDDKMMIAKMHELVYMIVRKEFDLAEGTEHEMTIDLGGQKIKRADIDDTHDLIEKAADMQIEPIFFKKLIKDADFRNLLAELDITLEDQLGLFESLDADDSGDLTLPELIQGIRKLRGDPRRSDVIHVGLVVRDIQEKLGEFSQDVLTSLHAQERWLQHQTIVNGYPGVIA